MNKRIAIYGGTFDPIHYGHLRSIDELSTMLGFDEVKLIPSYIPPHRAHPGALAAQRIEMLRLAAREFPRLTIDDREIQRAGVSYSVDTVKEIRAETGSEAALFFVMGADAFALFHEWYEWQSLTNYCHIVVMERPGASTMDINPLVLEWRKDKLELEPETLEKQGFGKILNIQLMQWDISATKIRQQVVSEQSVHGLLPQAVIDYIEDHGLYQATHST